MMGLCDTRRGLHSPTSMARCLSRIPAECHLQIHLNRKRLQQVKEVNELRVPAIT